jgi:hypothetical protein
MQRLSFHCNHCLTITHNKIMVDDGGGGDDIDDKW